MDSKASEILNVKTFLGNKIVEPYIALTSNAHYIVVENNNEHSVVFIDPEQGRITEDISNFANNISGIVIFFSPNRKFTKKRNNNNFLKLIEE